MSGIVSNQFTDKIVFTNLTIIDSGFGAVAMVGLDGLELWAVIRNSTFYGETEARDCKAKNICNMNNLFRFLPELYTGCIDKTAIQISAFADHFKPALIKGMPAWPQYRIKADPSWGGNTLYENIRFKNFNTSTTWCGTMQRLFAINGLSPDYNPEVRLVNPIFENVHFDTYAYLFTPPNDWATIDDCGQFPCTGPNNILIKAINATFIGPNLPANQAPNF